MLLAFTMLTGYSTTAYAEAGATPNTSTGTIPHYATGEQVRADKYKFVESKVLEQPKQLQDVMEGTRVKRSAPAINNGTEGQFISLPDAMYYMSSAAYSDYKKGRKVAGWTLVEDTYTDVKTSFTAQLYRKQAENGLYSYTFAFRGTADKMDIVVDLRTVVLNNAKLQLEEAEKYVTKKLAEYGPTIKEVKYTGHSLGGYIASWIAAQAQDGAIQNGKNKPFSALTFNAPGLSQNVIPLWYPSKDFKFEVAAKIARDKWYNYDKVINNYQMKWDPVAIFGDNLGVVTIFNAKDTYANPFEYHKLKRFSEIDLGA
jgi:Protein of unknown function (DUF2974)